MQDFNLYFGLGLEHILSREAFDHLLFVAALCLRYQFPDWKKVAVMVTAFTIGHSITLALSALGYFDFPVEWVEFLIPLTIAGTALNNLFLNQEKQKAGLPLIYFLALFFGMIHGLAYANLLLNLEGKSSLVTHLLAFNLGIEAAQLLVVLIILSISHIFIHYFKLARALWIRGVSALILLFSVNMAVDRIPNSKSSTQTAILP